MNQQTKIGLDFGTSNSGVAIYRDGKVHVLPLDERNVLPEVVKSILYITRDYKIYTGQEAVQRYYRHNINRLRRYVKKWVGEIDVRGADMHYVRDIYVYVDELKPGRLLQFLKTALRSPDYEGTLVFERFYTPAELIAFYLRDLKARAEALLGETISGVTLGRPVHFHPDTEVDRRAEAALRQAAEMAGFKQVDFELEPVAAALFYEMTLPKPQNVLIFDFGGGTLDITVMRLGDPRRRQVFANGGIGIAGSDFDRAIIERRLLPHFGKGQVDNPVTLELVNTVADWIALPEISTPQARHRLEQDIQGGVAPARLTALKSLIFNDLAFTFYNAVESTKIELSSQAVALLRVQEKDIDLWELYTRFQLEKDIREHADQIEATLLETLEASGLEPGEIDAVVKTGGSSSIPLFNAMLARHFGREKIIASDVFSSVTAGLAIRAGG